MNRCPAQRDGDSGKVYRTALSTKYRTAAAPATSQDSLRRIRQLYVTMEWSTDGVQAHRRQCHYPGRSGQVQTVQRVTKFETGPVGGSPTRPGHQRVKPSTWCDDGSPSLDRPTYRRQRPLEALDRPWTVYRAHGYNGPNGPREIRKRGALTTVSSRVVCLVKRDEQEVMA